MSKVSSILSAFHALAIAITLASCEKVAIPEKSRRPLLVPHVLQRLPQ